MVARGLNRLSLICGNLSALVETAWTYSTASNLKSLHGIQRTAVSDMACAVLSSWQVRQQLLLLASGTHVVQ